MELKTFIEETLIQIVEGVKCAQDRSDKSKVMIMPNGVEVHREHNPHFYLGGRDQFVQVVEFEVVLTKQDANENSKGIGVAFASIGLGAKNKIEAKDEAVTRVKFSVPVLFYDKNDPLPDRKMAFS